MNAIGQAVWCVSFEKTSSMNLSCGKLPAEIELFEATQAEVIRIIRTIMRP